MPTARNPTGSDTQIKTQTIDDRASTSGQALGKLSARVDYEKDGVTLQLPPCPPILLQPMAFVSKIGSES